MIPILILFLLLLIIYYSTQSVSYKPNSQHVVIIGICVNCDKVVELTRSGQCAYCLSESIIRREPKRLVMSEGQRLLNKLNRTGR